jgi:pimeloyl-ACP methyl ester carboxylesterase
MSRFAFVHGAGDGGWHWHLLEAELRARGHATVAPDLPAGTPAATLDDYAGVVLEAIGRREDEEVVVVAQSYGGFTAPLVAARLPRARLVFVNAMVPAPGEAPRDWWGNTGYRATSPADPRECFYHDVPAALADEALGRERDHPSTASYEEPWPLAALPDVPTGYVLGTADRMFPADFQRRLVRERLGVEPVELDSGHCPALSRPAELAEVLLSRAP